MILTPSGKRRRPEGRCRRLAVLHHLFGPAALYRVSYSTTSHLPVANASADVTKDIEPLTVHFSSAGSYDPDGDPLSYHWTFGDGTTSTEANPTKTYTDKGVYTARLTVSAGGDQTPAQPIVVQVGVPPELNVAFPLRARCTGPATRSPTTRSRATLPAST